MIRTGFATIMMAGALALAGCSKLTETSRVVEHSVADVYAAIEDMDTDGSRNLVPSEGLMQDPTVVPPVSVTKVPNQSVSWHIFSGDVPAMTMTARLEPAEGGAATKIITEIVHHPLPQGVAPPVINILGGMEGVFDLAITQQLATLDPKLAADATAALEKQRNAAAMMATARIAANPMGVAMAGMKMEQDIRAMDREMKAADEARAAAAPATSYDTSGPNAVRFEPGKPMIRPN